jgi:isocitrate dehydrogenase
VSDKETVYYTLTDEAPSLATRAFYPVVKAFARKAGITTHTKNISLAARILSAFPDFLEKDQKMNNALAELGVMVKKPDSNIIKLPNISASLPQLKAAIAELRDKGYAVPEYPDDPQSDAGRSIKVRYDQIKGSAVNPVLREGNSDRRVPFAVKEFAKKHPQKMGRWTTGSKSCVDSMSSGDFYSSEKTIEILQPDTASIVFTAEDGKTSVLKEDLSLEKDEIIDAAVMNCKALRTYYKKEMEKAQQQQLLLSLHLKATMMKVSDPVIFGNALSVYFASLFEKYSRDLTTAGVNPDNGLGDLYKKISVLPAATQDAIKNEITACFKRGPAVAMVDSEKGISNFHVPSDIIIDASMPAAIRNSGKMWNAEGTLQDTIFMIPDRSYAGIYRAVVEYCKKHGAFNPAVMGTVSNVGLMARKAEEYGSHDTTFKAIGTGRIALLGSDGTVLLEQPVENGDIFRICRTKDDAVSDWIRLAVKRGRTTGQQIVFWLDENRSHDRAVLNRVKTGLSAVKTEDLSIRILSPDKACEFTMEQISAGHDVISASGNIIRDYLTDLFPILEVGTSAKMLSIVPLMAGGGLYETGAGGSAPKHVQQFIAENHLRWDSLGEFLALAESFSQTAEKTTDEKIRRHALTLSDSLNTAASEYLENRKGPSRKCGEQDNRTGQFYLTVYWARALAQQTTDEELRNVFMPLAQQLEAHEEEICSTFIAVQGKPVDIGGYYLPENSRADRAMRPSDVFNRLIDEF